MKPTTLSKSRFKLAVECPTKVFYSLDRAHYVNAKDDDDFLQALADGGFQVGELAKRMYAAEDPAAVEVTAREQEEQVRQTAELLQRENVTIFEGTIRHENLLVRVDVLVKRGSVVELIEVKSKSFDATKPNRSFLRQDGEPRAEWAPYLQDVAFQTHVFSLAYPGLAVRPFLLLVDPNVRCPIEGLGTAIRVNRDADHRAVVTVDPAFDVRAIDVPLLKKHDVAAIVARIATEDVDPPTGRVPFVEFVKSMSALAAAGARAEPRVGAQCKACEYYCDPAARSGTVRSGWAECIEQRFPGRGDARRSSTVFALYRHAASEPLLAQSKLLLSELDDDDIEGESSDAEISPAHRKRLQILESKDGVTATLLRKDTLRGAFGRWTFPLHFIDFETAAPTLPFTAGRRPHEQLLFQYSHHVMDEGGRVEHRTQCLVTEPGVVPNAAVVRSLRDALGRDAGTVLHWWTHENTVLKKVRDQLRTSTEADKDALIDFIGSLVDGPPARLVDMGLPLVSRTAFIAGTDGRSSIKKVLQAVLAQSDYLREKYGAPVYGTAAMPSLNFPAGWVWWQRQNGVVRDPYTLLGQLLSDAELDRVAREEEEDEASAFVANGGAAMVAYGELQRRDMAVAERERLEGQLLRYCELDTLAMVMVYEALREWVHV